LKIEILFNETAPSAKLKKMFPQDQISLQTIFCWPHCTERKARFERTTNSDRVHSQALLALYKMQKPSSHRSRVVPAFVGRRSSMLQEDARSPGIGHSSSNRSAVLQEQTFPSHQWQELDSLTSTEQIIQILQEVERIVDLELVMDNDCCDEADTTTSSSAQQSGSPRLLQPTGERFIFREQLEYIVHLLFSAATRTEGQHEYPIK
jgi:hypothetical protein